MRRLFSLLTVVLLLCLHLTPVAANDDIARLSDEEVRALLLERLAEPEAKPEPIFNPAEIAYQVQLGFARVHSRAREILGAYDQLPALPREWWTRMTRGRDGKAFGAFAAIFLVSVAAGIVASILLRRKLNRVADAAGQKSSLAASFAGRLVRHGAGVLALVIVATLVFFVLAPGDQRDRTLFFFYLSAVAIVTIVAGASRALFEPTNAAGRVPAMTDKDAQRFHRSVLISTAFGAFGFFSCASFAALGIHGDVHALLLVIVGAGTTFLLSFTVWGSRHAIAGDILAGASDPSPLRRTFSSLWPVFAAAAPPVLFVSVLISIFLGGLPLYGAALFTIMALILTPIGESALGRAVCVLQGTEQITATILARVSRIALLLLVVILLAVAWRINLTASGETGVSGRVFQALIQIIATTAVAYSVWQVLRVFLDQKIAAEDRAYAELHGVDMEAEQGGAGKSRTRTLLPLLRRAALIVLFTIVIIVSLSAMGVDTGPLLAGAGVVGLAIGFGSQTLVKDVVSGFFFLLEDAFRLGEYIDIGKAKGTVESISVRSMKLRHHRGALNTVPFGSVDVIENFGRDWAIMKLKVRVPFETDLNMVRKLLKQVGQEMMEIEAIRDDFLQPFKAQGAVEVDDYGFVISTKFMSKPGKQFVIRRYAFQAMQDAFEENGIPFARPRVRVVMDDNEGDAPKKITDASAGAAVATILKSKTS